MKGVKVFLKGGAVIKVICEDAELKANKETGKLMGLTLMNQKRETINYLNVHEVAAITAYEIKEGEEKK